MPIPKPSVALDSDVLSRDRGRRFALRSFLMQCRARVHPEDVGLVSLGRRRVPGLRREEVAELAGITLAWYTQLETGDDIRVSPRVLDRISLALQLTGEEKAYLFSLAIDELATLAPRLRPQSLALHEAFASMRVLSQRLWVATTEQEALTIAREHCARVLAPDAMVSALRTGLGKWNVQRTGDTSAVRRTFEITAYIVANWPPASRDELHLFGVLKRPGDVMTRSEAAMSPDLASRFGTRRDDVKWPALDNVIMAAVHSRNGLVARLTAMNERPQSYSQTDRAMLSAIADLTSFALADAPNATHQAEHIS
jgi:transcriptional regulator with XRE-family HTH domain